MPLPPPLLLLLAAALLLLQLTLRVRAVCRDLDLPPAASDREAEALLLLEAMAPFMVPARAVCCLGAK